VLLAPSLFAFRANRDDRFRNTFTYWQLATGDWWLGVAGHRQASVLRVLLIPHSEFRTPHLVMVPVTMCMLCVLGVAN